MVAKKRETKPEGEVGKAYEYRQGTQKNRGLLAGLGRGVGGPTIGRGRTVIVPFVPARKKKKNGTKSDADILQLGDTWNGSAIVFVIVVIVVVVVVLIVLSR